jgi:hypothetical protein
MAKQLTVRGVPDHVAEQLEQLSRARGQSVNATVNQILADAFAVELRLRRLERYMTWTKDDVNEVMEAVAAQRRIDDELWR